MIRYSAVSIISFSWFIISWTFSSCGTTTELILDDPTYIEKMLNAALEGKEFHITPEDYPHIRLLFFDDDTRWYRSGIILAGQTQDKIFYPDILTAALDENPKIMNTAMEVIRKNTQDFRHYLLELLENTNPSIRKNALIILGHIGGEDLVPILIHLFNDQEEEVRNQASSIVHAIADRKNPFLQEALDHPKALVASIAYRTLGLYANPNDTPLFITAFTEHNSKIRKEAQLAVFRIGERGLPFLHIEASNRENPFDSRIASINLIHGLRSPESLSTLLKLLTDKNEGIRTKVSSILGTYGAEAIPALNTLYQESGVSLRLHAVKLMGEIGASIAIPLLAEALADTSSEVRQAARVSLESFGTESWPVLHSVIHTGDSTAKILAMQILRSGKNSWLVHHDSGEINFDGLFILITASETDELVNYIDFIEVGRLTGESILSLREAWDIAKEFTVLENHIASKTNSYIYLWRQHKILVATARDSLKHSFDVLHHYFETRDPSILDEARKIRRESQHLESEAQAHEALLDGLPQSVQTQGQNYLMHYKQLRNKLVRIWMYIDREMRDVARAIYADRGLNPEVLSHESVLLEEYNTVQSDVSPKF